MSIEIDTERNALSGSLLISTQHIRLRLIWPGGLCEHYRHAQAGWQLAQPVLVRWSDETSNDLSWANPWPRIPGLSDSILWNPVSIAGGVSRPPCDYVVVYTLQPAVWQFLGKPETPFDF